MGIKISELTETSQLSDGCCIPVVNNGTTKKIKIKNLKTQLNPYFSIENGHLFADGIDIGEVQGANGKTAYELACEYGFVGTEEDFAQGLIASVDSGLITESYVKETVNNAVAEIVANAPEDFDTLKEMSDWISEHEDDATAMNTAIQTNKTNIATEITNRTNADTNLQNQINENKITVDTAMSSTSTNPVQNKVVSTQINTLSSNLNTLATQVGAMNSGYACAYVCDTASGTKAKRITVKGFELLVGTCIKVVFLLGNEVSKPTLNVNSTGDKEIMLHRFKDGYDQDLSLDGTNGFYTWNQYTTLDLYYTGAGWIVLGNPVVCDNAGYPTSPQYRICIDGYKEIRGTYNYGNISSKKDINVSMSLPCALVEPTYCHVSLTTRHSAESYPQSGEEMTYYLSSSTLKIHFFNRNESTTMNGVLFDYMICGY